MKLPRRTFLHLAAELQLCQSHRLLPYSVRTR
jgi:hypothetical protein